MGNGKRLLGIVSAALAAFATACAAPIRKETVPVFFPPAPAPARIQYLTSFAGLKDIEEQSAFNKFIVGEKQDLKVDKPYGVGISDGKIYACDTNQTVVVFDLKHKTFRPLTGATGAGTLRQPSNISIEPDGTKYVADPVRGQVVAFDRNDDYLRAYGLPGAWRPVDAVPFADRLYVADPQNHNIKIFDKHTGEALKTIGDKGDPSQHLNRPTNLAFDREGSLYVTDAGRFQVVKFDRDGHFRMTIGKLGDNLGHFARPKGIALDREGRLFAVDAAFNNVQIFNPEGRLLMYFGEGGDKPGGLLLPAKVTIDYENLSYFQPYAAPGFDIEALVLVTNQFGPRRITIFGYGRQRGMSYPSDAELLKQLEHRSKEAFDKTPATTPPEAPAQ